MKIKKIMSVALLCAFISCEKSEITFSENSSVTLTEQPAVMNYQLVDEMVANYRENQLKAIQNSGDQLLIEDAQSIWFGLETLKNFILNIETTVGENTEFATKQLGIRFYYAAYPETSKWDKPNYESLQDLLNDDVTRQYEKKHTLVMIPTIATSNTKNTDFNPLDITTYSDGFGDYSNLQKSNNYKTLTNTTSTIIAQNHGSLIPPADG